MFGKINDRRTFPKLILSALPASLVWRGNDILLHPSQPIGCESAHMDIDRFYS